MGRFPTSARRGCCSGCCLEVFDCSEARFEQRIGQSSLSVVVVLLFAACALGRAGQKLGEGVVGCAAMSGCML
jgi:hypothetical protein